MGKKWDGKGYASYVDYYKDEWEKKGNPLNVWRAYSECRGACIEIPEWVYEYFDRVGDNFWRLLAADTPPGKGKISPAIAEALEMKRGGKGGRDNVFTDFLGNGSDKYILAMEVDWYLREGHKKGIACEYVATANGESKSTVSNAWKEWGPIYFKDSYNKKIIK